MSWDQTVPGQRSRGQDQAEHCSLRQPASETPAFVHDLGDSKWETKRQDFKGIESGLGSEEEREWKGNKRGPQHGQEEDASCVWEAGQFRDVLAPPASGLWSYSFWKLQSDPCNPCNHTLSPGESALSGCFQALGLGVAGAQPPGKTPPPGGLSQSVHSLPPAPAQRQAHNPNGPMRLRPRISAGSSEKKKTLSLKKKKKEIF